MYSEECSEFDCEEEAYFDYYQYTNFDEIETDEHDVDFLNTILKQELDKEKELMYYDDDELDNSIQEFAGY
jgi:hypothetical protein